MEIFLYIVLGWVSVGLIGSFVRFFILFNGPSHLFSCHKYDKRTSEAITKLLDNVGISYKNDQHMARTYMKICFIISLMIPFIPFIDMLNEHALFSKGFVPLKKDEDEKEEDAPPSEFYFIDDDGFVVLSESLDIRTIRDHLKRGILELDDFGRVKVKGTSQNDVPDQKPLDNNQTTVD